MRVLLVSSGSGSRGGGEIFLQYLAKGLTNFGHDVCLWAPDHERMDELAETCASICTVVRSPYRNTYDYKARSLATVFNHDVSHRIAKEWVHLRPDVIHLNKQNLEDGLDLIRAATLSGLPSLCTLHLTQSARFLKARAHWVRDVVARSALRNYGGILVAVQDTRMEELRAFLGPSARLETILNGVPVPNRTLRSKLRATKRCELGLGDDDRLVLGVGRIVAQKRPFLFLEKAQSLLAHWPSARFLWVGDGGLRAEWERRIESAGLQDRIRCAGWQSDVSSFMAAGDMMLHVAEFEGLPLALIEAMAMRLPCIVLSDLLAEIGVLSENQVFLADDVADLAVTARSKTAQALVAENARKLVEQKLTIEAMTASYVRLYKDAIAARLLDAGLRTVS